MRGSKVTGKWERKLPRSTRKSRVQWEDLDGQHVQYFSSAKQAKAWSHVLHGLRNAGEIIWDVRIRLVH
jgi:hypothetical protein